MRSSNPALISNPFTGFGRLVTQGMTIRGTVNKTFLLLALVLLPAVLIWKQFMQTQSLAPVQTWMWVGMLGGLGCAIATIIKKNWAPITAPLYAVMQGLFLGGISAVFEQAYPGIVLQAVSLSIGTLFIMLIAYQAGWVRATEKFKLGVVAATGAIALVYVVSIVLSFFNIQVPLINGSGTFSLLFSIFVVGIAALNFILDFDFIEQGARANIPQYMEWYGAFALMVTLIWLYLEMLRLLAKINERK